MKYITRFTEDCFASLVALIFIYDAFREVLKIGVRYPVNYNPGAVLDYSCSCLFSNATLKNLAVSNTNVPEYLLKGSSLNETAQMVCAEVGGLLRGSGCSTPVYQPDVFFYSIILFVFTFFICMALQEFRNSSFFPTKVN